MILGYIDPGTGFTVVSVGAGLVAVIVGFFTVILAFFKKIWRFFKNNKKKIFITVLCLIIIFLAVAGLRANRKMSSFDKKIIILGFDGLSPDIIEPMMRKGMLPNFSRLKQNGSYRILRTTNPSQSPVAWTGFSTGQNPGKNGVFDFIERDIDTYNLKLSLSNIEKGVPKKVIKSKCFWEYSSDLGVPATILACPITFPPDKVTGRMLSGMGVPDILGTEGTFSFYTSEHLERGKDIGGKVFQVRKSPLIMIDLIGPKVAAGTGPAKNVKVPAKVTIDGDNKGVVIQYQDNKVRLPLYKWSAWQDVVFKLGPFKRSHGIFKFYLSEIVPHFKLYISPIEFDPRHPYFTITHPPGYSKELARAIGLYHTRGMPMDTWAVNENRLSDEAFIEQVDEVLREKTEMLNYELARFKKGILYCYFESSDIIQHMFWRYTDPLHPLYREDAKREFKETIAVWYEKLDAVLGRVIDTISDNDTLIVLSDHGFDTFRRAVHINSWLRKNDFLKLKSPYASSGAELLSDIDWSRTKAYSIGFGAIYVNQLSRERFGIVSPGYHTEQLKDEIAQKLGEWIDEKYDEKVVNKVYKREEIFWGRYQNEMPDLYVGFNIGYRASWQTALGAVPRNLIEDNLKKWSGSHLFDPELIPGILFTNKKVIKARPSIYDIAPTVLKLIGYDDKELRECDFDGAPLF